MTSNTHSSMRKSILGADISTMRNKKSATRNEDWLSNGDQLSCACSCHASGGVPSGNERPEISQGLPMCRLRLDN